MPLKVLLVTVGVAIGGLTSLPPNLKKATAMPCGIALLADFKVFYRFFTAINDKLGSMIYSYYLSRMSTVGYRPP